MGDIGHLDEEGYLTITDRVSDMVLWGGVNIAPREIEEVLFEHPAVVDCAVFGVPDERDGERLKAMVQLRAEVSTDELAELVAAVARYKVPREWEVVDELPRDQNGKVRKRQLREAHRPRPRRGRGPGMIRIGSTADKCVGSGTASSGPRPPSTWTTRASRWSSTRPVTPRTASGWRPRAARPRPSPSEPVDGAAGDEAED